MMIEVWTDGSSLRNGKPDCVGGWSFVTFRGQKRIVRYGNLAAPSSNNRSEIAGVLYGAAMFHSLDQEMLYWSDSQYVGNSIKEWRHKHKKTNYQGIKNVDMLLPLYTLWDTQGKSSINWVKGHASDYGNQQADEWCGMGSRNIQKYVNDEFNDTKFISEEDLWKLVTRSLQSVKTK